MEKILVWHQGALGDLILSLPVIYAIKSSGMSLHLISRTDIAGILIESGFADEVSAIDNGLFADFFVEGPLSPRASKFLEDFGSAFVFMKNRDEVFEGSLRSRIRKCFFIKTVPPDGEVVHLTSFQAGQLVQYGIMGKEAPPLSVKPFHPDVSRGRKIITMHPGSGGKKKCWPLNKFLELMKLLNIAEMPLFYFILGPAEDREMKETAMAFIAANDIDAAIVTNRPLSYIARLLKASSFYIGNDSGITHLASALGTPTVAIFGPTDPGIWGPAGGNVRVVASDCLDALGAGDVFIASKTFL